jgi:hypothetical protein
MTLVLLSLVPRLCLGTEIQRLCLEELAEENWRQSLRICVTRQSLVTSRKGLKSSLQTYINSFKKPTHICKIIISFEPQAIPSKL